MNIRILFIGSSLNLANGGVDRVTGVLSSFFEELGFSCFFTFRSQVKNCVPKEKGLILEYVQKRDKWEPSFRKFLIDNKISIIINQAQWDRNLASFLLDLKKERLCKIITCFHVSPNFYEPIRSFKGKIVDIPFKMIHGTVRALYGAKLATEYSDKFVLLSNSFIKDFVKRAGIGKEASNICAIPNPLSFTDSFHYDFSKKKKQVVICTRLEDQQKNISSALRIWRFVSKVQTDWNLIIAGHGSSENELKAYAKELQLERVSFIGCTDNPQDLYKESSIFMMTSRYEGFGMTLTEAQQFGCVPFAFDNFSVLHDIIDNEKNGIIIPSNSEDEYAKKMLSLMENHEKLDTLAKQAIKDCQKFSIENIGRQWLELFDTIIYEKRGTYDREKNG